MVDGDERGAVAAVTVGRRNRSAGREPTAVRLSTTRHINVPGARTLVTAKENRRLTSSVTPRRTGR
jgi:hypothetical protein